MKKEMTRRSKINRRTRKAHETVARGAKNALGQKSVQERRKSKDLWCSSYRSPRAIDSRASRSRNRGTREGSTGGDSRGRRRDTTERGEIERVCRVVGRGVGVARGKRRWEESVAVAVAVAATAAVEPGGNAKERLRCEAGSDAGGGGQNVHGSGGGGYGACHYTLAGGVRVPRNLLSLYSLPSSKQIVLSFLRSRFL